MSDSPRRSRRLAGLSALSALSALPAEAESDFEIPQPYSFSEWMTEDRYPNREPRRPTTCTTVAAITATGLAYLSLFVVAARTFSSGACANCI
jgi:hypothetical protein